MLGANMGFINFTAKFILYIPPINPHYYLYNGKTFGYVYYYTFVRAHIIVVGSVCENATMTIM